MPSCTRGRLTKVRVFVTVGAVSRVLSAPWLPAARGDHSSRPLVTRWLERHYPGTRTSRPRPPPKERPVPVWSCSGWGLPCEPCYQDPGALLPHPFTLTNPFGSGGLLSVALSLGLPPPDVIRHPALWSSDFPPPAEAGSDHPPRSGEHTLPQDGDIFTDVNACTGIRHRSLEDRSGIRQDPLAGGAHAADRGARGPARRHGADHGRERNRQGADGRRAGDPLFPGHGAVPQVQLRRKTWPRRSCSARYRCGISICGSGN